jgi:hypothetical protein
MRSFNILADLDELGIDVVRAISRVLETPHVTVLSTWNGCDKVTGDLPQRQESTGEVNLEWLLRAGRFRMDLQVWGKGIPPTMTEARFAREVAKGIGDPVLFSDCHLFPWSYLVARPNEEDRLDLLPEHPAFPDDRDYFPREVLYGPTDLLIDADPGRGDRSDPPEYCAIFNRSCPKMVRCIQVPTPR